MKIIFFNFLIYTLSLSNSYLSNIGVMTNNVNNSEYIELAVKVIENNLNSINIKQQIKIKTYKNGKKIIEDFKNNKINILLIHPFTYFKYKNIIDKIYSSKHFLSINNTVKNQYYIIANKKSKNIFNNLKDITLLTPDIFTNAKFWIEDLIYKKYNKSIANVFLEHKYVTKEDKIVNRVFFKTKYLGVVSKHAYDILKEINPQIGKRITILFKSEKIFISSIIFINKFTSKEEKINLIDINNKIKKLMGNSILSSQGSVKIVNNFNQKDLESFHNFYTEYKNQERKYKEIK